ncbi:MAG: MarR family transcriptional regulator [Bacteroidetes bacterium]|nr:MarR family transcriptional regulator [Bacteroidota bacterium]
MKFEDEIKQKKFSSTGQKAFLNVVFTANYLQGFVRDRLKPYGLTLQQYNVLRILRGRHPQCAYPTDIKDVMLDKNPDLTRLCDRMVLNGWIVRAVDEKNRRKMKISITEKGLQLLTSLDELMDGVQDEMAYLSDEENMMLSDLLDKMRG